MTNNDFVSQEVLGEILQAHKNYFEPPNKNYRLKIGDYEVLVHFGKESNTYEGVLFRNSIFARERGNLVYNNSIINKEIITLKNMNLNPEQNFSDKKFGVLCIALLSVGIEAIVKQENVFLMRSRTNKTVAYLHKEMGYEVVEMTPHTFDMEKDIFQQGLILPKIIAEKNISRENILQYRLS